MTSNNKRITKEQRYTQHSQETDLVFTRSFIQTLSFQSQESIKKKRKEKGCNGNNLHLQSYALIILFISASYIQHLTSTASKKKKKE